MFDYLFFIAALAIPFFLGGVKTYRRGLVAGLFLSLLYWGKLNPILSLVPLGTALCIYLANRSSYPPRGEVLHVKSSALPMLVVFIIAMAVFCAFEDSFSLYGSYIGVGAYALNLSGNLDKIAYLLGPILLGNWCDRKGPFGAAIFLTLLSEIAVWCAANGHNGTALFVTGSFLMRLCTSGFFVLLPILVYTFFGSHHFSRIYPAMALAAAFPWICGRLVWLRQWSVWYNPGSFMISLSLLAIVSAIFIFAAWKRRITLVAEDKLQQTS